MSLQLSWNQKQWSKRIILLMALFLGAINIRAAEVPSPDKTLASRLAP